MRSQTLRACGAQEDIHLQAGTRLKPGVRHLRTVRLRLEKVTGFKALKSRLSEIFSSPRRAVVIEPSLTWCTEQPTGLPLIPFLPDACFRIRSWFRSLVQVRPNFLERRQQMKRPLPQATFAALLISSLLAVAADTPQGYVLYEGEQACQALAGNLLRVAVREIVRSDGSKATVYRDVDYPVREAAPDGSMRVDRPAQESPFNAKSKNDRDEAKAIDTGNAEPAAPKKYAAYIFLGPEYEEPPPPGTSPSPNRRRRTGPASVKYEWDQYKESGGKGDEFLRLELDFSGTQVTVRSGYWSMEAEAGTTAPTKEPGFDFSCEQGAYGTALGRFETRDLHQGSPDEIIVTLLRRKDPESRSVPLDDDSPPPPPEGTGTYRLKRAP